MLSEFSIVGTGCSIADYTRTELIVPRLRESDPAGIIAELSSRLHARNLIGDRLSFYHAAINRELLADSSLPMGIATPHTRSSQVKRLALAIGRCARPVAWNITESYLVEYVFLIAVPATEAMGYLSLLSGIVAFYYQPELLARLRMAADAQEIYELLKEVRVGPG